MELKIGTYTVVCEVTNKETGYFNLTEFSLKVTSAFSEGFYILKETTDGNTDMDFYNDRQKTVIPGRDCFSTGRSTKRETLQYVPGI